MSKQDIENVRAKLAADREQTFRRKLAALMAEMETAKRVDDFVVNELLTPSLAGA